MYDEKKLELRLRALEAICSAQQELLDLVAKRVIADTSHGFDLRAQLQQLSAYVGPSDERKALAHIAGRALSP